MAYDREGYGSWGKPKGWSTIFGEEGTDDDGGDEPSEDENHVSHGLSLLN